MNIHNAENELKKELYLFHVEFENKFNCLTFNDQKKCFNYFVIKMFKNAITKN